MIYYTVYRVTNKVNGKVYIGCHKTRNLEDGYMGSGKLITYAIEKHGVDAFEKEVLHVFDNPEEMFAKEAELVDDEFLSEANTYNLKTGGMGGFDHVNQNGLNLYGRNGKTPNVPENFRRGNETRRRKLATNPQYRQRLSEKISRSVKESIADGCKTTFAGRKHTEESKRKIGNTNSKRQRGSGNSQYGTRWIHSPELKQSKRIAKTEPLPEGWQEGRKIKFK